MAAIRIVRGGSVPWLSPKSGQSGEKVEVEEFGETGASRYLHPGSESDLYLHLSRTRPNMEIHSHAHRESEIIYVTEGELHLGAQILGPGDSVFIPGNTLYGFRTGPEGVTFLNFRGRRDTSHVSKDEFMAERALAREEASSSPAQ